MIANYGELVSSVYDILVRDSVDLPVGRINDAIQNVEKQFDTNLRCRAQRASFQYDLGVSSTRVPLPSDYLELINLIISHTWTTDGSGTISRTETDLYPPLRPDSFQSLVEYGPTVGPPQRFAEIPDGANWMVWPYQSGFTITGYYYRKTSNLSEAQPTNFLLTAEPDLYQFGVLAECEMILKMPPEERGPWAARFASRFDALNTAGRRTAASGGRLITRAAYGHR